MSPVVSGAHRGAGPHRIPSAVSFVVFVVAVFERSSEVYPS